MPASPASPARRAPRARTSPETRLNLSKLIHEASPAPAPASGDPADPTIDMLLDTMAPYVRGMIETIGLASQPSGEGDTRKPGDTSAAKIGLEFLSRALSGRASRAGQDILREIARIRGSTPGDS